MNIAFFSNNYLPNPYGVSRSIESFRIELERRGHSVFVFVPKWKGYSDKSIRVFRYPSVDIAYKFRFPLPIPYSRRMNAILNSLHLDVIHAHHPNLLGSVALRLAKKRNIPLIFTWHTRYDQYAHFGMKPMGTWFAHRMIRKAAQFSNESDAVIAPSGSMKSRIHAWGVQQKHIHIIPTGIDSKEAVLCNKAEARSFFGFRPEDIVLVTASRFTQEKNVEFLFHAIISVLKRFHNARFLAVGGGNLLPKLKQKIIECGMKDRVVFSGEADRSYVWKCLSAGDMFVYASRSETQGVVVAEAMYAQLPVVAVRAPGVNDAVMDKVSGLLVPENQDSFSQAVEMLFLNKSRRYEFGLRGREIVERTFLVESCVNRLVDLYEEIKCKRSLV